VRAAQVLARYELVGHRVDVAVALLQRAAPPPAAAATLPDALRWQLAARRLAPDGMPALNSVFIQRLAKVLHCAMLRLPRAHERAACGRAVLALFRLALARFRGKFAQPVAAMPMPRVDGGTLPEAPLAGGLLAAKGAQAEGGVGEDVGTRRLLQLVEAWADGQSADVRSRGCGLVLGPCCIHSSP
jgi:hypothetical protein